MLYLPFDVLQREADVERAALHVLLNSACEVFDKLGISATRVMENKEFLIENLRSDPMMFDYR